MGPGTRKPERMIDNCEVGRGKSKGKRMKGNENVMKTVQSFFCVELKYLKSSSGGHLSERRRSGHVKQRTRLKILC